MKAIFILSVIIIGAFCANPIHETLIRDMFSQWKLAHQKIYKTTSEEEHRFATFVQNYMTILATNKAQSDVVLGLNQFADLNTEEFTAMYTGYKPGNRSNAKAFDLTVGDLPTKVDWREKGAVTPVKNQGSCGSCWAFSAVGALEGLYQIHNGELKSFSEQQLVDCETKSQGCKGGWMSWAFEYSAKKGLETEKDYPYVARAKKCAAKDEKEVHINSAYVNVTAKSNVAMKTALSVQPVSVAIQANQAVFQFYKAGVILTGCGDGLNHGVLAVGYDTYTGGVEAFIVKNSWGSSWGNKGYVLISTNESANKGNGVCGILADACYPTH